MQLKINGVEIKENDTLLFGDFLSVLNKNLANESKVISEIRVNGKYIDEIQEQNLAMLQLSKIGDIHILTANPLNLAMDALVSAQEYIKKIIPHSIRVGFFYKNNNVNIANKKFMDLVEALDNLTNLMLAAQNILRGKIKGINTNDSSLRIAQVRLVSAIEELLEAKSKNDILHLADVLCNELPEALKEMADYGIPVMLRAKINQ